MWRVSIPATVHADIEVIIVKSGSKLHVEWCSVRGKKSDRLDGVCFTPLIVDLVVRFLREPIDDNQTDDTPN